MKKLLISLIVILILAGVGAAAYYYKYGKTPEPEISTLPISRGDIVQVVPATGTIEAVTVVDVGTQVSGKVTELNVDFNSMVVKGDRIAKIDPQTIEAKIEMDKAQLLSSEANLERQRVALEDSQIKLQRAKDLFDRKLLSQQDYEAAQVTVKTNEAQIKSQLAGITQQKATLHQDEVNLSYTDIFAPINGIVIDKKVDVGQTVVSNQTATPIVKIAADLTNMQVKANVDESDVGMIRPGQLATFTVDAYQTQPFTGTVAQVRLQPIVTQNVVTYITIINVRNDDLRLKPGMTANVKIEIFRSEDVLRIPNAALRFRPTEEIFAALKQEMPQELRRGRGGMRGAGSQNAMAGQGRRNGEAAFNRGGGDRATGGTEAASRSTSMGPGGRQAAGTSRGQSTGRPGEGRGGQGGQFSARMGGGRGGEGGLQMTDEQRRQRMQERMAQMTPEQREQWLARMKERGFDPNNPQAGRQGGTFGRGPSGQGQRGPASPRPAPAGGPDVGGIASRGTIDALFGPLAKTEARNQRVWVVADKKLKMIGGLRTGISDGTFTELIEGPINEKTTVVTGVDLGASSPTQNNRNVNSPFMPQRGMGPGGFGGGGRGGR